MPGISQLPVSAAGAQAKALHERGIRAAILFGLPKTKDDRGSSGLDPEGPVPLAVREMKSAVPDLVVMTDVCVDEYTDHGHCGILPTRRDGVVEVDNDATVEVLAQMAVMHASAGADVVAPSDMMDGRVGAIREALDGSGPRDHRHHELRGEVRERVLRAVPRGGRLRAEVRRPCRLPDGPRERARGAPRGGARRGRGRRHSDGEAGSYAYLDVLRDVRRATNLPLAAYNVSGEYSMLHAAAAAGMIDLDRAMMEVLTSIRRAGADLILTYHALRAAELLGG